MANERMVNDMYKWNTRPIIRWMDDTANDLKAMKINNWIRCIEKRKI